jgi:DNA-binding response OmpR family regulator
MNRDKSKILVCDDEVDVREMLKEYLEKRGFEVFEASDAQSLRDTLSETQIDLILLDINMPGEDGLSVLRTLRDEKDIFVVMLTAAGDVVDRIIGLEMGADDYLSKPVDLRELEARLKAVLRRKEKNQPQESLSATQEVAGRISFGRCTLDISGAKLFDENETEVPITAMEFSLLKVFAENPKRVLNRDQILEQAHDRGWDPFDRSVDIRVSRLRRKIEPIPDKPQVLKTIRGIGYMFEPSS